MTTVRIKRVTDDRPFSTIRRDFLPGYPCYGSSHRGVKPHGTEGSSTFPKG